MPTKQNEEVYLILSGQGLFYLDGEELAVREGDVLRVDPAARRCIKADANSSLRFVCIQAKANSLTQFTGKLTACRQKASPAGCNFRRGRAGVWKSGATLPQTAASPQPQRVAASPSTPRGVKW